MHGSIEPVALVVFCLLVLIEIAEGIVSICKVNWRLERAEKLCIDRLCMSSWLEMHVSSD
jgi:hypothetical protein